MDFDKKETIERLKLEIDIIEKGGYHPSVRHPREELRSFRDSITCLNVGLEEKVEPCDTCFLIQFVPEDKRDAEDPCHHIPLNDRGDTVASLTGNKDKLDAALLAWLKRTVARLESELAAES